LRKTSAPEPPHPRSLRSLDLSPLGRGDRNLRLPRPLRLAGARLPLPGGERVGVRGFGSLRKTSAPEPPHPRSLCSLDLSPLGRGDRNLRLPRCFRLAGARLPLPGGERVGVRGFGLMGIKRSANFRQNAIYVFQNVVVPEAQDQVAHCFQDFCSLPIGALSNGMLSAIKLNDQMRVGAKEIDNEPIDWTLPSKFPTSETPIAQSEPKCPFGICLIAAQPPRSLRTCLHRPSPLTPTLSPKGKGSSRCLPPRVSIRPWTGRSPSK